MPGPGGGVWSRRGTCSGGGGGLVRAFIHISKQGVKDIPQ